jgi:hypothetical protein
MHPAAAAHESIAAEATPATPDSGVATQVNLTTTDSSIAASAAPTEGMPSIDRPITRSAVLEAIARGKARRDDKGTQRS